MTLRYINNLSDAIYKAHISYPRIQQEFERAAMMLMRQGKMWFDQFLQTGLWLACHRLVKKGRAVETAPNFFRPVKV